MARLTAARRLPAISKWCFQYASEDITSLPVLSPLVQTVRVQITPVFVRLPRWDKFARVPSASLSLA